MSVKEHISPGDPPDPLILKVPHADAVRSHGSDAVQQGIRVDRG